jgi:DNA-binding transcriptional ArsR family regulator
MPLSEKDLVKLREYLTSDKFRRNRAILRALSGQVRYNILGVLGLSKNGLTVTELAKIFDYSVSRVSHQLRILRKYNLVDIKRNGKSMIYSISANPFLRATIDKWKKYAHKSI